MSKEKMRLEIREGKIKKVVKCDFCSYGCVECEGGWRYYDATKEEIVESNNGLSKENDELKYELRSIEIRLGDIKKWIEGTIEDIEEYMEEVG